MTIEDSGLSVIRVSAGLERHERECALRYGAIEDKLGTLRNRFDEKIGDLDAKFDEKFDHVAIQFESLERVLEELKDTNKWAFRGIVAGAIAIALKSFLGV